MVLHRPELRLGGAAVRAGGRWEPTRVAVRRGGDGVVALRVGASGADRVRLRFAAARGERWLGFGERSDAVARSRGTVVDDVSEGPYASKAEYAAVSATIPPWGLRRARDATYFPMPWLVSTRGYGVLVDGAATSRFRLGRHAWTVEVDAPRAVLHVFPGPGVGDVVRRLSARIGRQPAPPDWAFGPWVQTGHANEVPGELRHLDALRRADAPLSVAETQLRYLPCQDDRPLRATERARTAAMHARGLAVLTYVNSEVCSDTPLFARGVAAGAFERHADGSPYTFTAYVGGRGPTPVAQFDFSRPAGAALFDAVADRTVADGHDGFMEDYGEYSPPDAAGVAPGGLRPPPPLGWRLGDTPQSDEGVLPHNAYPLLYHRAGERWAARQERPVLRFVRSGWTGSARFSPVVWGGDPTTGWGFDGLRSALREGLTMGLSGVGVWGSDIGGFFTLGPQRLDAELLARWIELGAVSGVMRTKAEGIGVPLAERPQVWERPTLPIWRRYAKLRTQLSPYVEAAAAEYRRTGLPIMRSLAFADARLAGVDDELLFGGDLLAAPVLRPGARRRSVVLPPGRWIDLWRAARYDGRTGALRLSGGQPARGARTGARRGGRRVSVAAPLDRLPLFVRAGAILPLLPADVDTLAPYGRGRGLVHPDDRLVLLAFPRGRSESPLGARGVARSALGRRAWELRVRSPRERRVTLEAALPFRPCRVAAGGRRLARSRWSFRHGVLRARFTARRTTLRAAGC